MTCPSTERHDSYTAYKMDGCRCPAARAIYSRRLKRQRSHQIMGKPILVDAEPTRRRLHALARMGWPQREVIARVKVPARPNRSITSARVNRFLHDDVARVYNELCMIPGPSKRARTMAANAGWAAPLDWDDIDDLSEEPSSHKQWQARVRRAEYERTRRPARRSVAA